jgi:hypothetical protein
MKNYSESGVAVAAAAAELRSAWTGEGARPHTTKGRLSWGFTEN